MAVKTIGITMGDPSGVGPEVIVKAFNSEEIKHIKNSTRFIIFGDDDTFAKTALKLGTAFDCSLISALDQVDKDNNKSNLFLFNPIPVRKSTGEMSLGYIISAIDAAYQGNTKKPRIIDAIVTGPVSKNSINKNGFSFKGHTELLARKTNSRKYVMMFVSDNLKVSLVTTHVPYKKLLLHLNTGAILNTIKITNDSLKQYFNLPEPSIAVCGLNPHAGEDGLFGKEEKEIIGPAVEAAKQLGILCYGPFPADSLFYRAQKGEFDAVVALYHDQGIIPVKTISFFKMVQITLGLPIIRTSVAHGTAFDISGKNVADPGSMIAAIRLAREMIENKALLF
ncbi:MAG: 4-hydroxythreonine-4-phosphate dehydrogenase PdxA [Candidatus Brocadiia bacterium]